MFKNKKSEKISIILSILPLILSVISILLTIALHNKDIEIDNIKNKPNLHIANMDSSANKINIFNESNPFKPIQTEYCTLLVVTANNIPIRYLDIKNQYKIKVVEKDKLVESLELTNKIDFDIINKYIKKINPQYTLKVFFISKISGTDYQDKYYFKKFLPLEIYNNGDEIESPYSTSEIIMNNSYSNNVTINLVDKGEKENTDLVIDTLTPLLKDQFIPNNK